MDLALLFDLGYKLYPGSNISSDGNLRTSLYYFCGKFAIRK